ncbi:hypothetical protein [Peterkaempfera griseoplana]|uniref:hypothetical protein n=1 Tax=Peterkaempfera griseoplana TaxID=66896 RepID=UPI0012FEFF4E|nr:hypothetical protein [Peterkaempfera griseoplana]
MMDYEFAQYRARDLERQAAHERLVREAVAARREQPGHRPGLLRRLGAVVRPSGSASSARLREC